MIPIEATASMPNVIAHLIGWHSYILQTATHSYWLWLYTQAHYKQLKCNTHGGNLNGIPNSMCRRFFLWWYPIYTGSVWGKCHRKSLISEKKQKSTNLNENPQYEWEKSRAKNQATLTVSESIQWNIYWNIFADQIFSHVSHSSAALIMEFSAQSEKISCASNPHLRDPPMWHKPFLIII